MYSYLMNYLVILIIGLVLGVKGKEFQLKYHNDSKPILSDDMIPKEMFDKLMTYYRIELVNCRADVNYCVNQCNKDLNPH